MKYYAYLSSAKVDQLHDQISNFMVEKQIQKRELDKSIDGQLGAKAIFGYLDANLKFGRRSKITSELVGVHNSLHKLEDVLNYIHKYEHALDLNQLIADNNQINHSAFCYTYKGKFRVAKSIYSDQDENYRNIREENDFGSAELTSNISVLESTCNDYVLELACSNKFFSDMGCSRNADNSFRVTPHSGNYHFFRGSVEANFEVVLFVNGQTDNRILATPLFILNSNESNLHI